MDNAKNAVHSFMCTNRMHRRVADKTVSAAGIDLHRSQHMLLVHLRHCEDGYSQKELAEHLNISPAALAVKIKKLESDGFITRAKNPDDSRTNAVSITPKGKAILDKTYKLFSGIDARMIEGIPEEQLQNFVQCLNKMYSNLEKLYQNPAILEEEM